jgi:hypothetical protein
MKMSTIMTNHDPRMNMISSIVLVELPPNTASVRYPLVLEVSHLVPVILFVDCLMCFFECALLLCARASFNLSTLKTLW